jgi:hypothetical protein
MNQIRRLIVSDSNKTPAGKVSVPVLSQFFLQIFSKSAKGEYFQIEGPAPAPVSKFKEKSAVVVKPCGCAHPLRRVLPGAHRISIQQRSCMR